MAATVELACPNCRWHTVCGATQMLAWLRGVNMVRRDQAPEPELLPELVRAAAERLTCPDCDATGLSVGDVDDGDDESWGMARACESCGKPIARERLEVVPEARLCVTCQGRSDRGQLPGEVEYCPRCGSAMTLRQSHRGVTRYVMACPNCRS